MKVLGENWTESGHPKTLLSEYSLIEHKKKFWLCGFFHYLLLSKNDLDLGNKMLQIFK